MTGLKIPESAIGVENTVAYVSNVAPTSRAEDFGCPACDRLADLLSSRGGDAAEFPLSERPRPDLLDYSEANADYQAFVDDDDVRVRYLVQAHLHWFGYYPELARRRRPGPPDRMLVNHQAFVGFPGSYVNGLWGDRSKNAYRAFLVDCGPEGRTGWNHEDDVLRAVDVALVRSRCGALWTRPGFDYYTEYRLTLTRKGRTRTGVRPFLFREANLASQSAADPRLTEVVAAEADLEPRQRLTCNGETVDADFAPDAVPANACWPVIPWLTDPSEGASENARLAAADFPEELTAKGVDERTVRRLYPLYRYNPDRWLISYLTTDRATRRIGPGTRMFHSPRGSERMHAGLDLYGDYGDPVVAAMDGVITGFHNSAPLATCFLFVYHEELDVSINYGEVHHESLMRMGLMVGDRVQAGQLIGAVGRMSSNGRNLGSMLHVGTYRGRHGRWFGVSPVTNLRNRLNPTKLFKALRAREAERRGG